MDCPPTYTKSFRRPSVTTRARLCVSVTETLETHALIVGCLVRVSGSCLPAFSCTLKAQKVPVQTRPPTSVATTNWDLKRPNHCAVFTFALVTLSPFADPPKVSSPSPFTPECLHTRRVFSVFKGRDTTTSTEPHPSRNVDRGAWTGSGSTRRKDTQNHLRPKRAPTDTKESGSLGLEKSRSFLEEFLMKVEWGTKKRTYRMIYRIKRETKLGA